MIERQRMQGEIVRGDLGIDEATDILRDHRVMRQHRALRRGFGAAGVDDLRQIAAARSDIRRRGVRMRRGHRSAIMPAAGSLGLLGRQPDEIAHGGVERGCAARASAARPRVGGEHGCAGVPQDVGDFLGLQHEIDRHQHRAESRQRKPHRDKGVRVARQHRDARALGDAALCQTGGHARADAVELGIGPSGIAAHHGQFGRASAPALRRNKSARV